MKLLSLTAVVAASAMPSNPAVLLDASFPRAAPGQILREAKMASEPMVAFKNFSAAYVAKALATPTNWTAMGAVTPAKNQGPHG